jgi:DUF1680 family protein
VRNGERFNQYPDTFTTNNGGLILTSRPKPCESCATYNLLKLTALMFIHQPDAKYMDYYERALYNDMIGSIAPDNSANTYHKGVGAGNNKENYSSIYTAANAPRQEFVGHTPGYNCCGGSAMEAHTKYQDSIYSHQGNDVLYVNLYLPSTLTWGSRTIKQRNNFPSNDELKIIVEGSGTFDMNLRIPYYATNGFTVAINGVVQNINALPSSYITLSRDWTSGDVVTLKIPMDFHLWEAPDAPNIASIMYGPMVLFGNDAASLASYVKVTVDPTDIGSVFAVKDFGTMTFTLPASYNYGADITRVLRPWYQFTNQPNSGYYDIVME